MLRSFCGSAVLMVAAALSCATSAQANNAPDIPEPMVFDMVRALGAEQGELEINTLAQMSPWDSGRVEWAPEIEYALFDRFAVELELPFENTRLSELKFGLQGTFGTFNNGQAIHGVQYLGIHDRHDGSYTSTLVYILGQRLGARLSSVTMVGIGGVDLGSRKGHNAMIVNHSVFADLSDRSTAGVEVNFEGGRQGGLLLMPQMHHTLAPGTQLQAGFGVEKNRGASTTPRFGVRLIREL
ncbi:hypothetical protein [Croceibacterium ferulae]|uniref:hypothetical protein n=1 Tax=Croceibacterium ferulae TaxID=1854641 RepID=UPI001F4E0719|nr:hypothetical protein [Croceibacterium ferulae]